LFVPPAGASSPFYQEGRQRHDEDQQALLNLIAMQEQSAAAELSNEVRKILHTSLKNYNEY